VGSGSAVSPLPQRGLDLSHNTDNYHGGSEHPRRKGVGDRKWDWTGREREGTKREEKWEICPGLGKAVCGNLAERRHVCVSTLTVGIICIDVN